MKFESVCYSKLLYCIMTGFYVFTNTSTTTTTAATTVTSARNAGSRHESEFCEIFQLF